MKYSFHILLVLIATIFACSKEENQQEKLVFEELPAHFPKLIFPNDNNYSIERWQLGKKLFYDPILSRDHSISCATCHIQESAFASNDPTSIGIEDRIGKRNVPALFNLAYHPSFTREGGVPTLEMQIFVPIQEHDEMDFNIVLAAERMSEDSSYVRMSDGAYNRITDAFVITRALANFERSLISSDSRYDQYLSSGTTLSSNELNGLSLFNSEELACAKCHSGFNLTNYSFENNGLYKVYEDEGRFRLTRDSADLAMFKVPSLRNVELTAPYMHDGSLKTLEEVLDHYASGGHSHSNKNPNINGFTLTEEDKYDLLSFLKSLTDITLVQNPLFEKE